MAKRKKQAPRTGMDKVAEAPLSFEEFKRREHEQALKDFRNAERQFETQKRLVELVVAERDLLERERRENGQEAAGPSSLGANITWFRLECGWTIEELATAVEVDKTTVLRHIKKGAK